ncbi:hypothetical protein BU15DRAFT_67094 [Melanogaster broomeanus]|nr:hypothetical protein BU15DRAFT_67094 [Melanogaster broomeanus]
MTVIKDESDDCEEACADGVVGGAVGWEAVVATSLLPGWLCGAILLAGREPRVCMMWDFSSEVQTGEQEYERTVELLSTGGRLYGPSPAKTKIAINNHKATSKSIKTHGDNNIAN